MGRYCLDACGVAAASPTARETVSHAVDDSAQLGRCPIDVVVEALDALDTCRRERCSAHADESDARVRLQTLVDEAEQLDAAHEFAQEDRHAAE